MLCIVIGKPGGKKMEITKDIRYIGVNDHEIKIFESQYSVQHGMAYNSYVILDEKTAVLDTTEADFAEEWLANLRAALDGRKPDYLIVQHMEPDHSSQIARFMESYPEAVLVSSMAAFNMMKQFFGTDYAERRLVIKEGDTLSLGKHVLSFIAAPMVHWPEVMVTYDALDKVLFSADGFGKFGSLDADEDWAPEASRYYFGIVGKFGMQVQALLKKAAALDIRIICPLHGPVLSENLGYYLGLYNTWSSYTPQEDGILVAYTSVYGNTRKAATLLAEKLKEKGCPKVVLTDLTREDMAECVANAFRLSKLVLATTTYNNGIFPYMREFISSLTERNFQNRTVAFVENGTWAPAGLRVMRPMFDGCKDISFAQNNVTIRSALNDESLAQMDALVSELCS
jgi:flavorubredoxin